MRFILMPQPADDFGEDCEKQNVPISPDFLPATFPLTRHRPLDNLCVEFPMVELGECNSVAEDSHAEVKNA